MYGGQRRSYIGSESERPLVKNSLSPIAAPRFHMPDILPVVLHSCELSTASIQGRSCLRLHFRVTLPGAFLPRGLPEQWGKMGERVGHQIRTWPTFKTQIGLPLLVPSLEISSVLSPLSKQL